MFCNLCGNSSMKTTHNAKTDDICMRYKRFMFLNVDNLIK